ncbi:MAG: septum site-determining protein MinC, partial [Prochlorococcus sp.]
ARGPEDQPQAGLAEEARIDEGGAIMIEPASTKKFNG